MYMYIFKYIYIYVYEYVYIGIYICAYVTNFVYICDSDSKARNMDSNEYGFSSVHKRFIE
jgi:hypothetical protein